jgi:hypothetical protein
MFLGRVLATWVMNSLRWWQWWVGGGQARIEIKYLITLLVFISSHGHARVPALRYCWPRTGYNSTGVKTLRSRFQRRHIGKIQQPVKSCICISASASALLRPRWPEIVREKELITSVVSARNYNWGSVAWVLGRQRAKLRRWYPFDRCVQVFFFIS